MGKNQKYLFKITEIPLVRSCFHNCATSPFEKYSSSSLYGCVRLHVSNSCRTYIKKNISRTKFFGSSDPNFFVYLRDLGFSYIPAIHRFWRCARRAHKIHFRDSNIPLSIFVCKRLRRSSDSTDYFYLLLRSGIDHSPDANVYWPYFMVQ